jgi:hypothetical protein
MACFKGTLFSYLPFHFPRFPLSVMLSGFGICYHSAKVFTGYQRAVKFEPAVATKILPLSLSGERNFRAKLDSPKPYTVLAYETKMTDPTDDAYKKSQHDEER